jgi:transposase
MMIIGCDFHPSWQEIAWLDGETGETRGTETGAASGDAKAFYQQLAAPARIGMEATGNSQWFIELVRDLGHEIWIGDAAQIQASYVRKQKTDKMDAAHILKLVVKAASAPVDAEPRATRSAAVSVAPAQTGGDSEPGEKRTATPFSE